ncbi:GNAT family N-acetyltransferase [Actinoplanes oblitus]|uniref:GNAT family N-acetyltransferase n=1 Tax=Actinoplanes oblitus TaxID=3040509 RepID=A0ABY8W428_9ACTN|nr:GNAT family N-acetyltransferase [Actinoplanes oblitus]WIM92575.1 GNAT family N-acetyltransferase [Actinoplanes oblitus]
MIAPEIVVATPADRSRIVASLVATFARDPVIRWLFPSDDTYPEHAAAFFGHLFDKRVERGAVFVAEGGNAVAIWEPPADGGPLTPLPAPSMPADVQERLDAYDRMMHTLLPEQPYWYLGVLGTHPDHHGRRLGHAVMAEGLKRAADAGLPAILETGTEGNVRMYERAGWQVIASATAPIPIWVLSQGR